MSTEKKMLQDFIASDAYRDICYFMNHTYNQDVFNSCCEQLGYEVGVDIINPKDKGIKVKSVTLGKRGEFRIISNIDSKNPSIAECVIVKPNNK